MFPRSVRLKTILKPFFIKNYSEAVSLKKTVKTKFKKHRQEDLISMALNTIEIRKPQDWNKVKQFVLNHELNGNKSYNCKNIDAKIMGSCVSNLQRADLAKTYLRYLEEQNIQPNLSTLGKYLQFLYRNNTEKNSKEDEKEIIKLCDEIRDNNPVLDSFTLDSMVSALSLTKEWKKCLNILEEIKITASPSTSTYSALIAAAFLNKEEELAWNLLKELIDQGKKPQSIALLRYLTTLKKLRKRQNIIEKLEKLFLFFQQYELVCQEDVAKSISEFCKGSGILTTVKFSGYCENCKSKLDKMELSDQEFLELKESFLKNAIIGRDIFIKSNPVEMQQFQDFVSKMGKIDVVLDGLNVAYSAGINKGPQVFSKMIAAVVSHFVKQNKSVLVLGRVNMTKWPKKHWSYITNHSTVFLTENISQDDPYLLYCALHAGKDTIIVTKDLMRGHKHVLKERKYKTLFNRWLSQRQYFLSHIDEQNKVTFRVPPFFTPVAQKNRNIWHIPYTPESDDSINASFQKTWLCLNISK